MKKLVLFVAIVATVAFSACKKAAPAEVTPQEDAIEAVTPSDEPTVDSESTGVDATQEGNE
jgi:hypothetical protein